MELSLARLEHVARGLEERVGRTQKRAARKGSPCALVERCEPFEAHREAFRIPQGAREPHGITKGGASLLVAIPVERSEAEVEERGQLAHVVAQLACQQDASWASASARA